MAIDVELLAKLSNQVLEHIKELGLFDEMRMKLFNDLETSKEFSQIQAEFGQDIDEFCRKKAGQMNLPRAKLREQLDREQEQRFRSTNLLELNVRRLFRKHQHELRSLYNKQANDYLLSLQQQQQQHHHHHPLPQQKHQQPQLHELDHQQHQHQQHHKQQLQLQQRKQQHQNRPEPPEHLNHNHQQHQNRGRQQQRRRSQKLRKHHRRRGQQRTLPSVAARCHSKRVD